MSAPRVAFGALLLSLVLTAVSCGVGQKQSGLPAGTQATIDTVTSDLARGDYEKIYADAAEEWRQTARAEESRANLERIRQTLGSVLSRAQLSAQERGDGGSGDSGQGRMLVVSYNTKFERADAIETFTLVEREGRWSLARYAVNSNALR
ncbi:MAG: hypothetical protein QOE47_1042 [Pyrinomonadaceae bacterium]|jgi:hypothetical protein|nr:hypothetical protein [Pyrinomonadaceae bacterium]